MRGRWDVGPTMAAASRPGGPSGAPPGGPSSLGRPGGPLPSPSSVPVGGPSSSFPGASCSSAGVRKGGPHPPPPRYTHAYTLRDTSMRVNGLCFSSDGSLLFLSSWDCTLHIHDVRRSIPIRSLHAHRHGIESAYLLSTSNHLCLCPTKLQGGPLPASKQDKPHQQPTVQGGREGPGGGAPLPPPAEGLLGVPGAPPSAAAGVPAPPTFGREGGNSYSLRLWDLRENRYVRVTQVTGRVIPGTGVCVHPSYATFFCCTDDGFVKYFNSDRESCMWKRQTKTRRPLAAIDKDGLVGAIYEGGGRVSLWDLVDLEEPFAAFSIAPYLLLYQQHHQQHHQQQQQQQQQEIPISLNFSPDGSLLIVGTDRGRLVAFNSFTGAPAAVWAPPGGPSFFSSPLDTEGGPFLSDGAATGRGFSLSSRSSSRSSSSSSVCNEGFIPAIDSFTGTLFCGSTDGWVYGYDLSQAEQGSPSSAAHQRGGPHEGPSSSCTTCGGRVGSRAGEGGPTRERRWGGPPSSQHECCCDITFKPSCRVGPHWAPPLWVAANPKYSVVATAGINCSLWKAEVG
ncbi:hypothetical protein ACSSS7_006014 [Eimeria intestinalis]